MTSSISSLTICSCDVTLAKILWNNETIWTCHINVSLSYLNCIKSTPTKITIDFFFYSKHLFNMATIVCIIMVKTYYFLWWSSQNIALGGVGEVTRSNRSSSEWFGVLLGAQNRGTIKLAEEIVFYRPNCTYYS